MPCPEGPNGDHNLINIGTFENPGKHVCSHCRETFVIPSHLDVDEALQDTQPKGHIPAEDVERDFRDWEDEQSPPGLASFYAYFLPGMLLVNTIVLGLVLYQLVGAVNELSRILEIFQNLK